MVLLEVSGVKKKFGSDSVLNGVSFNVREGEIFGLVGLSGGGKSTLFNILMGLLEKDSGEILFENLQIEKNKKKMIMNTGFATQSDMIFEELTIKENCIYFGSLYGLTKKEIKERMRDLLILLGLEKFESRLVRNLSGGMKKRANILVSIIHNPRLLILDEPTAGLDPILRKTFWAYIKQINKIGTTIIIASHLLDEISENCHRIAVLKNGKIGAVGAPHEYREKFGRNYTIGEIIEYILSK